MHKKFPLFQVHFAKPENSVLIYLENILGTTGVPTSALNPRIIKLIGK